MRGGNADLVDLLCAERLFPEMLREDNRPYIRIGLDLLPDDTIRASYLDPIDPCALFFKQGHKVFRQSVICLHREKNLDLIICHPENKNLLKISLII